MATSPEVADTFASLRDERARLDRTVWSAEVEAQQHEDRIVAFWDTLRARQHAPEIWKALPLEQLDLGTRSAVRVHERDIQEVAYSADPDGQRLSRDEYLAWIDALVTDQWLVTQTEWHHTQFQRISEGGAASRISFSVDLANERSNERATARGVLTVRWAGIADEAGLPIPVGVGVEQVTVLRRAGTAPLTEWHTIESDARYPRLMPILLSDLDGNGLSDIVLGGNNRILFNEGNGKFTPERLSGENLEIYDAAVLADFNGDGREDLLCVDRQRFPLLLEGDERGRFTRPSRRCADVEFTLPKTFSAGDVDGDGDLDVFIGQYKFAYQAGSMPTPFYDANDGDPSVLLINDGTGSFRDGTDDAGLSAKRNRRVYSASLVDLDDDRDLDLIVMSDYAGIDLYRNDGQGRFADVTAEWVQEPHLFGMSHAIADFDGDSAADIYAIGMSSTTARRLDALQLERPDRPDISRMRGAMGYGNRILLARGEGELRHFIAPEFADQVARTGWSWGTSTPDIDNDGDRDIYVVNGHSSGKSAKDYCTRFWCHDIYTGSSQNNQEVFRLFGESLLPLRKGEISWNGFEHNVLYLNEGGRAFTNVAHLLGVAHEFDSRGAGSDDLDGDGRPDLLVVASRDEGTRTRYTLHLMRNELQTNHHWIGLRLDQNRIRRTPIGAKVYCHTPNRKQLVQILNGDSFSTQHAAVAHFGLGTETQVLRLEVVWPDGTRSTLDEPAIDQYHIPAP